LPPPRWRRSADAARSDELDGLDDLVQPIAPTGLHALRAHESKPADDVGGRVPGHALPNGEAGQPEGRLSPFANGDADLGSAGIIGVSPYSPNGGRGRSGCAGVTGAPYHHVAAPSVERIAIA
jgi:hypothetical protein